MGLSASSLSLKGPYFEIDHRDARFPESLKSIDKAPETLYGIGNTDALRAGLAVIGARKATPYGLNCASHFAQLAAEKGVCVISGGARGCDGQAHRGALKGKGETVVFLGGGINHIYPPEHLALFQEIIDAGGVILSEHPPDFKPLPYTFRARNRLIAGLSRVVLIVEAGLPSGTFSTADEALSQGKEVLVVPGAITSSASQGSNRLLFQGAHPIVDDDSFHDVLLSCFGALKHVGQAPKDKNPLRENPLIQAILAHAMSTDELYELAELTWGSQQAQAMMTESLATAELKGLITRHSDGRWMAAGQALIS